MTQPSESSPLTNVLDQHPYLRQALDIVDDKWVVAVMYVLFRGKKRYGELQREIGNVSQRMLTRTLRNLERDGLVHREVYPVAPPVVEYSLTELGESLADVLITLCDWSKQNFDVVEIARTAYDDKSQS